MTPDVVTASTRIASLNHHHHYHQSYHPHHQHHHELVLPQVQPGRQTIFFAPPSLLGSHKELPGDTLILLCVLQTLLPLYVIYMIYICALPSQVKSSKRKESKGLYDIVEEEKKGEKRWWTSKGIDVWHKGLFRRFPFEERFVFCFANCKALHEITRVCVYKCG